MSGAARVGDNHICPAVSGGPHTGGAILPPCSTNVFTNGLPQARASDKLLCAVPAPNFIVTGSASVFVNGLPAARMLDMTMHPPPGQIMVGSIDVTIGGPPMGATLGNPAAGAAAFQAAAAGRTSGGTQQSYQNCGVESTRQLINQATGASITEDALLSSSLSAGHAVQEPSLADSGGTSPTSRSAILAENGVASNLQPATMDNIVQAVAERRGVVTSHEVLHLWGGPQSGSHAIVVTGVEFNSAGNVANVIINDTGTGQGSRSVPAAQYQRSLLPGRQANVTANPIW
jgi:uncharacterized Zn-binding protein involved in type VI secretion